MNVLLTDSHDSGILNSGDFSPNPHSLSPHCSSWQVSQVDWFLACVCPVLLPWNRYLNPESGGGPPFFLFFFFCFSISLSYVEDWRRIGGNYQSVSLCYCWHRKHCKLCCCQQLIYFLKRQIVTSFSFSENILFLSIFFSLSLFFFFLKVLGCSRIWSGRGCLLEK